MALNPPPIQENTTTKFGHFPQVWVKWFTSVWRILSGADALKLKVVTVATLPDIAGTAGNIIAVSDEIGGYVLAFSDGTNWRRVTDRAIVS